MQISENLAELITWLHRLPPCANWVNAKSMEVKQTTIGNIKYTEQYRLCMLILNSEKGCKYINQPRCEYLLKPSITSLVNGNEWSLSGIKIDILQRAWLFFSNQRRSFVIWGQTTASTFHWIIIANYFSAGSVSRWPGQSFCLSNVVCTVEQECEGPAMRSLLIIWFWITF